MILDLIIPTVLDSALREWSVSVPGGSPQRAERFHAVVGEFMGSCSLSAAGSTRIMLRGIGLFRHDGSACLFGVPHFVVRLMAHRSR
jgi:hypothetical protein